jgi:predicted HD superfamily hydrolase involved in NAD metabolism
VLLANLCGNLHLTGNIAEDVSAFLHHHHHPETALHCQHVATAAREVAIVTQTNPTQAHTAGWLHDVSAIFPASERVQIARALGLEVLAEEDRCPMIVHQKLSRLMAQEIFGVTDALILDAVGCHTTLRPQPTTLDKVLFVADKLAWDQPGTPPYAQALQAALARSLDQATLFFLTYLWERRDSLLVIHPWLRAAVRDLCGGTEEEAQAS